MPIAFQAFFLFREELLQFFDLPAYPAKLGRFFDFKIGEDVAAVTRAQADFIRKTQFRQDLPDRLLGAEPFH